MRRSKKFHSLAFNGTGPAPTRRKEFLRKKNFAIIIRKTFLNSINAKTLYPMRYSHVFLFAKNFTRNRSSLHQGSTRDPPTELPWTPLLKRFPLLDQMRWHPLEETLQ